MMFKDIELAVSQVAPDGGDCHLMLAVVVTASGDLQPRMRGAAQQIGD